MSVYNYVKNVFCYIRLLFTAALECAALAAPVNGIVLMPSRTVGSTALYSCNEGFELTGEMSSTCLFTRQWNGTAPTCTSRKERERMMFV